MQHYYLSSKYCPESEFLGRGLSSECFFVLLIVAKVLMKEVCLVITLNKTRHTHTHTPSLNTLM